MKNDYDFSDAIKKIKEDCKLFGMSKNYLAEPLKEHGYKVQVTAGDDERVVKEYFVTPEEVAAFEESRRQKRAE